MKQIFFSALCLLCCRLFAQPLPQLIRDINAGDNNSDPGRFSIINDVVYFFANDGVNGIELWHTDGTESGTSMVKNIGTGIASACTSTFGCGSEFIVMDDILYFRASDNVNGTEIWRSDGTEAGTHIVKDINPGLGECSNSVFMSGQYFTVMDHVLYFAADGGGNNIELWRSDGTDAGTYLVKDLAVGESSVPQYLSAIDGFLYFQCKNAAGESELWKTDGTEAGCVLLKTIWVRSYDYKGAFFKYGDYIYFSGGVDPYDLELWRTDGTPSGTVLFKEINASSGSDPREFHELNGKFIFTARNAGEDILFASDGTPGGTVPLQDKNGDDFSVSFYFLQAESRIYFNGDNADSDYGLWVTDGTSAGTSFLYSIESGAFEKYTAAVVSGNNIVYSSYDDDNGCTTVFQSNGTVAGTQQAMSCETLNYPYEMISYNDKVIMNASNDTYGSEAWLFEPAFATAVDDAKPDESLHIYPNPASEFITIDNTSDHISEDIIILNSLGQTVHTISLLSRTYTIDITSFPAGIYFLQAGSSFTEFIKQ